MKNMYLVDPTIISIPEFYLKSDFFLNIFRHQFLLYTLISILVIFAIRRLRFARLLLLLILKKKYNVHLWREWNKYIQGVPQWAIFPGQIEHTNNITSYCKNLRLLRTSYHLTNNIFRQPEPQTWKTLMWTIFEGNITRKKNVIPSVNCNRTHF